MNDVDPHHSDEDRPVLDPAVTGRIERHLEASADQLDLALGPIAAVQGRARRRTLRRRRSGAIGVIAAASISVVGGVGFLTRSEPTRVATHGDSDTNDARGAIDTGSPVQVTGPAEELGGDGPSAGSAVEPAAEAPSAADPFGTLAEAQVAEPAFVWKAVEPGKDQSISASFGRSSDSTFPTFALSTAPGRSNDYDNLETTLYRTDDGVEWTQTDAQAPFTSNFWNATVSDDRVFVTGTAPGIADTEPSLLKIAVGEGDAWEIAELPIDTNQQTDLPFVEATGPNVSSTPLGEGALVVVAQGFNPDYQAISEAHDADPSSLTVVEQTADGMVLLDRACLNEQEGSYDAADELFGPEGEQPALSRTVPFGEIQSGDEYFGCPVTVRSWSDLGLPPESIDALTTRTSRFFVVSNSLEVAEIDAPASGMFSATEGQQATVESVGQCCGDHLRRRFELVDGAWVESPSITQTALTQQGVIVRELDGRRLGFFGTQEDGRMPFMSIADDGTSKGVDLRPLLAAEASAGSWSEYSTVSRGHWVGAVEVTDDPIALAGGIDVPFGDVIVRQATQSSRFEVIDAATREPIDRSLVSGTQNGSIEVRREDGSVRAQFDVESVYEALQSGFGQQGPTRHSIITTADGQSMSVESVADLLGLSDAAVSRVARVASDGVTVVVTVTLNERYDDDTRKQMVLVGTPIG